jgi:hypothetical protein
MISPDTIKGKIEAYREMYKYLEILKGKKVLNDRIWKILKNNLMTKISDLAEEYYDMYPKGGNHELD